MPRFQAYNKRIGAWVIYEFKKKGFTVVNVKQRKPQIPFKNILKRGKKK